ncbi:MAG: NAD(P)-binding domain-containing protein [Pyrinomonadaceae bacterium MAG19_C2-C3]|nr:NAD(P)-binding domain-containing protein [Pyrinomonadaceae bacterium MAG19_C2-C3]
MEQLDLLIIGAGPAGISAADCAKQAGLNYLVLERGLIGDTIYHYPVGCPVFSTVDELELREGALHPAREKPTREELLSYYVRFCLDNDLKINTGEEATQIDRDDAHDGFRVRTPRAKYRAAAILVCTGAMAHPRRLNVKGEDLPHVHHLFVEAYPYVRHPVVVVGGGNSAAEAALFLAEEGARTTLAILRSDWENRDPKKGAIKAWVRAPLEKQIERGTLHIVLLNHVEEFGEGFVRLITDDGEQMRLEAVAAFVLIGSDPDLTMLERAGVNILPAETFLIPEYDSQTFETNIPGIYVAGHFTRARHIKEAIAVPRRIVPRIAARRTQVVTQAA